MAADDVVSVQVQADVSQYVEGMKAASGATTQAMAGIQASTQAAGTAARDSLGKFAAGAKDAADAAKQVTSGLGALQASAAAAAVAAKEAEAAAAALKNELSPLAAAAKDGSAVVEGLGEQILKTGRKVRGEGRFANFIARDIQALVPAAGEAGAAVAGLVAGIAYGSGIAIAVSAVRLLVAAFSDTDGGVKKLEADSTVVLAKMKEQVEDIVAALNGETKGQNFQRKEVDPKEGKRDADYQALQDAQTKLAVQERLNDAQIDQSTYVNDALINAEKLRDAAQVRLNISETELKVAKEKAAVITSKESDKSGDADAVADAAAAARINAKRLESEAATNQKLLAEHVQLSDGEWKIDEENAVKIEGIHKETAERIKQINAEAEGKDVLAQAAADAAIAQAQIEEEEKVNLQSKIYVADTLKFRNDAEEKWNEDLRRWRGENLKLEVEAHKKIDELNASNDKNNVEREKRLEKFNSDQAKSYVKDFIGPVASASAGFFKGVLLQQQNVGDAIKNLMVGLAGAVIDGLVKMAEKAVLEAAASTAAAKAEAVSTTAGNIAMAATAAAASVAATPFVGPALAVAAFAETAAALTAGAAPYLASARGGMGEVMYDDQPALLHKKEIVWPAQFSDGARNMLSAFSSGSFTNGTPAPSGSSDATPIHVHVHNHFGVGAIVDQQSMDKHYSSPEFQTSIERAVRTGKARFR